MEYNIEITNENIIIKENETNYKIDLKDRLFEFSKNVIKMLIKLPYKRELDVFRTQLSRSATAIGANYEESQAGSYNEFRQRIQICLREARETHYWLRLIHDIIDDNKVQVQVKTLILESEEIKNIFGAISFKTRKNQ